MSEKPVHSCLRRLVDWINLTGAKKVHSLIDKVYKRKNLEMAEVIRDPRDFLIVVDHAEIVRNLKPDIAALAKIDMGISGGAIVTASGDKILPDREAR
jgi:hypothetical protein